MVPYLVTTRIEGISQPLRFCMLLSHEGDAEIRLTERFGHRLQSWTPKRLDIPATDRRKESQA